MDRTAADRYYAAKALKDKRPAFIDSAFTRKYNIPMKTKIIYEDNAILVCRKPAGLPVQTAEGYRPDMVSELKNELSRRMGRKNPYLGVIHRLDQPVEGLLVFARTKKAAAELSRQLTEGILKKKYMTVLSEIPRKKSGICVDYLKKDGRSNVSRVVSKGEKDARRAELSYEIVAVRGGDVPEGISAAHGKGTLEGGLAKQREALPRASSKPEETERAAALAEIEIKTGRHHQIRVQMAHMGCPLMGDTKYGAQGAPGAAAAAGELALCAYYLELDNPDTGQRQRFVTEPHARPFAIFAEETAKRAEDAGKNGA